MLRKTSLRSPPGSTVASLAENRIAFALLLKPYSWNPESYIAFKFDLLMQVSTRSHFKLFLWFGSTSPPKHFIVHSTAVIQVPSSLHLWQRQGPQTTSFETRLNGLGTFHNTLDPSFRHNLNHFFCEQYHRFFNHKRFLHLLQFYLNGLNTAISSGWIR